jgi:hypothetical protein
MWKQQMLRACKRLYAVRMVALVCVIASSSLVASGCILPKKHAEKNQTVKKKEKR